MKLETLLYYNGNNVEYICQAEIGARPEEPKWQIRKLFYDINSNITEMRFAELSQKYTKKVTMRESYKYGPKNETTLYAKQTIGAPYTYNVTSGDSLYTFYGDDGFLGDSHEEFMDSDYIVVFLNGEELKKGIDVEWLSSSTVRINKSLQKNRSIFLTS